MTREPPQRRGFGMVFQNYAIFPHLNVFENVAFPLRARGCRRPRSAARAATRSSWSGSSASPTATRAQFSGGQQQRVAIARAIVFQPSVVLMDEPLGALDKNLRYQMQVEIKEIQRRLGMTVVYVTHDQEEAMNMSDRIAIMNRGRIEQVGTPAEIYESPANTFIARFLGEANLIAGTVEGRRRRRHAQDARRSRLRARARPTLPVGYAGAASSFARSASTSAAAERRCAAAPANSRRPAGVRRRSFLGNIMRHAVEIVPGADVDGGRAERARRTSVPLDRPAVRSPGRRRTA